MKILIYSLGLPPFRRGGLVNYSVDLATQLAVNGHKVTFLYPGKMPLKSSHKVTFFKHSVKYPFDCYEMVNPLPVSLTFGNSSNPSLYYDTRDIQAFRNFIDKISPDVVHFHTIMGLPIEYVQLLKKQKIKTIFTTHDYYGLCPKMLEENPLKILGSSDCSYDCMLCQPGPSINKIKLMQSHFYQKFKNSPILQIIRNKQRENFNADKHVYKYDKNQVREQYKLRKYYLKMLSLFDCFHFNSSVAKSIYRKYLPHIKGKIVPIMIEGLKIYDVIHKIHNPIHIGFLGGTDPKKGIELLSDVCTDIYDSGTKFKVVCAGSDSNNIFLNKTLLKILVLYQGKKYPVCIKI